MNKNDIKSIINQVDYSIFERIDNRIIIYYKGLPIYSFKNLNDLIIKLDNKK